MFFEVFTITEEVLLLVQSAKDHNKWVALRIFVNQYPWLMIFGLESQVHVYLSQPHFM